MRMSLIRNGVALVGVSLLAAATAQADIDLMFVPLQEEVETGETVEVQLLAISDSEKDQLLSAVEMIFSWDPEVLILLGLHQDGATDLLSSGFPLAHPSGLNESDPPQDGIGMYMAWAPLGEPVAATPEGTLLTTFIFEALAAADPTEIDIVPFIGDPDDPDVKTIVFDGTTPNTDVTGILTGTSITIIEPGIPGDLTGDGTVGVADLLILIGAWGPCADCEDCPADLNSDCAVGIADLLVLINNWTG